MTELNFDCFNKYGYMVIKSAFSKETAELCRLKMWDQIKITHGVDRHDQSTWVPKVLSDKIWTRQDGLPWANVFTEKLQNAIDSLVGPNQVETLGAGWWTITFPGFAESPWGVDGNWHVDGHGYQHHPFSKEVGLVTMMLFSDILTGGGGTAIAEGSHLVASQILADVGLRGCSSKELSLSVLQSGIDFDITEITGEAGDVILLHPFLLHSRSKNLSSITEEGVRFLCHPSAPLKCHMDLTKPFKDLSVLEASIVRAIAGEEEEERKEEVEEEEDEEEEVVEKKREKEKNKEGRKCDVVQLNKERPSTIMNEKQIPDDVKECYLNTESISILEALSEENNLKSFYRKDVEKEKFSDNIKIKNISHKINGKQFNSNTKNKISEYFEKRKLLNFLTPEACKDFAERKKAKKNKLENWSLKYIDKEESEEYDDNDENDNDEDDNDEDGDEENDDEKREDVVDEENENEEEGKEKKEAEKIGHVVEATGESLVNDNIDNNVDLNKKECSDTQEQEHSSDHDAVSKLVRTFSDSYSYSKFESITPLYDTKSKRKKRKRVTETVHEKEMKMDKDKDKTIISDFPDDDSMMELMGFSNFKHSYKR